MNAMPPVSHPLPLEHARSDERNNSTEPVPRRGFQLRRRARDAFTILESVIACGIIAVSLGGVFVLNSQTMSILRMSRDEASASQVLQQRVEQMRIANWQRITNPTWLRDNILNVSADGSETLAKLVETVTVEPYNSATASTNLFTRSANVQAASTSNTSLLGEDAIKIVWSATWIGIPNNRTHTRQTVAILGKGGVAK